MKTARRIPVPGTYNFRDVGGYSASGGTIRSGKLFRSDGIHALGDTGKDELRELGVGVVIDLRDDFEVEAMPDDLAGLDVEVLQLPVFEGSGKSQDSVGITLEALYERIVTLHSDVVAAALRELAHSGEKAVLIHCTAGKDRTGIVVALALLAVGVDRETVIADYAESEANLRGAWLDGMLELIKSHDVEITPSLRILLGGSPPDALRSAIDLIEKKDGSVRQYLLDAGLSELDLASLRSVLVEPS
ncbi:tyrosine-protein phosphatase [Diaminobutyricibacter sp. McL0618]|uniref:tyrosine-protein phosphatase n=1 Tax=Leifsonia sp. McL0618 TaxID=3415677 RepID=UPI003CF5D46C